MGVPPTAYTSLMALVTLGDVGDGDAAEVVRFVDHGHEKVCGGDQRLLVVQPMHGHVVGGSNAAQQLVWQIQTRQVA